MRLNGASIAEAGSALGPVKLLRRLVKRLSFIDNVDRQELYRFVADNFESAMGNVTNVDVGKASWKGHLLAVG